MRFATLAALFLGASSTLALPAIEKRDTCCCCDPSYGPDACPAIVCQERDDQCICPAVACPTWAPTVWLDCVEPTPEPVKRSDDNDDNDDDDSSKSCSPPGKFECCCCNPARGAVVCDWRDGPEKCICPAIACPTEAPTIWDPQPPPTSTPEPCCCCNIAKGAIVCEMREEGQDDGCICPLVLCPTNAPTVTVWPGSAPPTPMP